MMEMNQEETNELMTEILANCKLKKSKNIDMAWRLPNPNAYDSVKEGISLIIDSSVIDESALNCIKEITKKHRLEYHWNAIGSQKVLEIYTPRNE